MKNILLAHRKGAQIGFVVAFSTIALTALPMLAADMTFEPNMSGLTNAFYQNHIISAFEKTGAETTFAFDNKTIDTSAFDFARYASHTCFRATENDKPNCEKEFGPYADLKGTLESGKLATILKGRQYLTDASKFLPAESVVAETTNSVTSIETTGMPGREVKVDENALFETMRQDRSKELWKICKRKNLDERTSMRCFQRNLRFMTDEGMNEENVY